MSINQSQVDHIISSASVDDPEVKLQNLQDEVDLLKKSVKKLLIDIRERMNELENPFILASAASAPSFAQPVPAPQTSHEEEKPVLQKDPVPEVPATLQPTSPVPEGYHSAAPLARHPQDMPPYNQLIADEAILKNLQQKLGEVQAAPEKPQEGKLHLQKLHQLFEWTNRMVKKYGHDRLEIMMQSYRTMGYIEEDASGQVIEIARLMPESLGECHEIGSKEFVSELYILNRILSPNDASLDRDMIEVLMAMHNNTTDVQKESTSDREGKTGASTDEWIKMLDRI